MRNLGEYHAVHVKGFTLIELLITIAIFAIVIVMGIPVFNEARARSELRGATNDVASALRFARSEAVRTNQSATVVLGSGVCTSAGGANAALRTTVGGVEQRCVTVDDFTRRYPTVNTLTALSISFNSRGVAMSTVPSYALNGRQSGMSRAVSVEASGRVVEGAT